MSDSGATGPKMAGLYPGFLSGAEIERFANVLADLAEQGPLDTAVPTCGAWTLADLTWHLLGVQEFWSYIIENRPAGPADYAQAPRPVDDLLPRSLRSAAARLADALGSCGADTPAWSWHAPDQSVGFSIRRQTHEALVHCCDGAIAVGGALPPVSPELAADGVDEMVNIMLCEVPGGAEFSRTSGVIELRATDTGDSWSVAIGQLVGPDSGADSRAFDRVDGERADLTVSASALELDLWLWGRPTSGDPALAGDKALVDQLRMPID